jgi:DNA polymerase III sliding clamp (beta) subunit (PCNA family)
MTFSAATEMPKILEELDRSIFMKDPAIALVPAQLLWAAAQFASTDECKELLTTICINTKVHDSDCYLEIASTDGHRLFKVVVPYSEHFFAYSDLIDKEKGFKIFAKPLKKAVSHAQYAVIRKSGQVEFMGGKKSATDLLCSVNANAREWQDATYPNYNQLIPASFGANSEKPIAFNAGYLSDFCKVVSKLSPNGTVKMQRNSDNTPAVFDCDYCLIDETSVKLECLIMPVVIR